MFKRITSIMIALSLVFTMAYATGTENEPSDKKDSSTQTAEEEKKDSEKKDSKKEEKKDNKENTDKKDDADKKDSVDKKSDEKENKDKESKNDKESNLVFKDIDEVKWASKYIEQVEKTGIVKGYTDNTYRPNNKITKSEAVMMIYRLISKSGDLKSEDNKALEEKYKKLMDDNNIAKWQGLRPALAYMIENKIIPEDDLKTFKEKDEEVDITREIMAYYLGNAVAKFITVEEESTVKLPYVDNSKINSDYASTILLLYRKKVFTGNDKNEFNPNDPITRAETAKVIVEALRVLEEKYMKRLPATIESIEDKKIVFTDDKNNKITETIKNEVEVLMNDSPILISDLKPEMDVTLTYKKDKLYKIDATPLELNEIDGIVTSVTNSDKFKKIYYKVNDDYDFIEYKESYNLIRDENEIKLSDVVKGDRIKIHIKNKEIEKITLSPQFKKYTGICQEITKKDGVVEIQLLENKEEKTFTIPKSTEITRNDKKADIDSLKIDDKLTITTTYDIVSSVESSSVITIINGLLKELTLGETINKVTIAVGEDGEKTVYEVPKATYVSIDGEKGSLADIELESPIEITLDGRDVVDVASYKKLIDEFEAKITHIDYEKQTFSIDKSNSHISYDVVLRPDTNIILPSGTKIEFKELEAEQRIFIRGYVKNNKFIANNIIKL